MRLNVNGSSCYAYTGSRPLAATAPTVVFVHGAANDHSIWALQSRYFAFHGCNVLAVDLPGHGRSAGPALATVEAIADWIARLLDAAKVDDAALVGHSLGSLAALACAAAHPERVRRLALLGPAVPMAVDDELIALAEADDPLAFELICGWSHSLGKQLGGNTVPGMWMSGGALHLMERTPAGILHRELLACRSYADGLTAAAAIRCPVLVIVGARDLMTPPKSAAALIAALPDHHVLTLPDTGHAMMAEQPDAVLDALRVFLQH